MLLEHVVSHPSCATCGNCKLFDTEPVSEPVSEFDLGHCLGHWGLVRHAQLRSGSPTQQPLRQPHSDICLRNLPVMVRRRPTESDGRSFLRFPSIMEVAKTISLSLSSDFKCVFALSRSVSMLRHAKRFCGNDAKWSKAANDDANDGLMSLMIRIDMPMVIEFWPNVKSSAPRSFWRLASAHPAATQSGPCVRDAFGPLGMPTRHGGEKIYEIKWYQMIEKAIELRVFDCFILVFLTRSWSRFIFGPVWEAPSNQNGSEWNNEWTGQKSVKKLLEDLRRSKKARTHC